RGIVKMKGLTQKNKNIFNCDCYNGRKPVITCTKPWTVFNSLMLNTVNKAFINTLVLVQPEISPFSKHNWCLESIMQLSEGVAVHKAPTAHQLPF
uniref:Uncharacterized protein n=1 Tax=Terrapene triunguis TaxID=2587831 RepID=A0A674ITX3_9SAUR